MSPVVVGHPSVILFNRQCKSYYAVLVKSSQPKQILKHKHAVKSLLMIVDIKWAEIVAVYARYFLWNSDFQTLFHFSVCARVMVA